MARKAPKAVVKSKAKLPKAVVKSKAKLPKAVGKSMGKLPVNPKPKILGKSKQQTKNVSHFEDIKRELILQREALLSKAGMVTNNTIVRVGSCPDLTDQASAESDQAFVLKLKEREQRLVTKIVETIERINQGTYGICQSCENPIPYPRLKARPVTTLCIECKTIEEKKENIRLG